MSPAVAPYGGWKSPITGESFTARSVSLSQVRVDGPDTYWVEGHPKEAGRNVLLRRTSLGQTSEVLPMIDGVRLPDVRTRVHEYGGRAYAVRDGVIVFSDGFDGRVYRYDVRTPTRGLIPLTPLSKVRYGDFEFDEARGLVYAVAEDHSGSGEPVNTLVAIPLDGLAGRDPSLVQTVFSGTDFVESPSVSPDGTKIAWLTWNHPEMPWTRSALHVAALGFAGEFRTSVTLVDRPDVCVYEPRWTLDGDLIHVDDSTGWANLYRTEGFVWRDGEEADAWTTRLRTRPLHPGRQAFSHPHWQLGLHSYDVFDNNRLICSWAEDMTWHIGTVQLDNGLEEEWSAGWWPIGNVASEDARVVLLADSATHAPAIVEIRDGVTHVIRPSTEAEIDPGMVSCAQILSWPTSDGEQAHGFYYPPVNPGFVAPEGTLPPLIVNVHGGPTSSARPGLSIARQYWTSRGFAVLDVNYRGSTGAGREYRERLTGNWGIMDVADCADGARYLIRQGLVDPSRVAIRGASAGGFTALAALASTDVFTAGTSLYGVSDLGALARDTHKFESRYAFRLVGSSDPSDPVWRERSPLFHIDKIAAPLLLLQGSEDAVVPPAQARSMHDALVAAGRRTALVVFDGEGHGFRRAETIRQAWAVELGFYGEVWGFEPDGGAEVEVANL
ncbi:MAG: prolyl oligopeptidase family serine peptidase [Actinomyces sp.]|jgi:dipeptidyl aminopeptidase/acylaminoacyl peptidase|nr:prolyl oligopeptidase family serine peptidase [Actinomyces sp.]MCI1641049.1 prolyl oligopeptidase family serine peptidase [Actinomyces sp.]MCI1661417.1 prolyl oligopeptidase family serine peptidase [Actinomyces sp.]MCI1690425.1 prolyl oligopeptidase family serine peptidase [Actinomyces sp.]MCI1787066.1 prolyl oligopeptidase family serine peptidase [Actinomyces sp.]MCI1829368.1 prolyl oligopeptidase family serine peptidase [Actinomyces sp.]